MPASGWIEPVTLRSGKRRWRVHWYDPGRRHRSRTFDKRAEAERFQAYVRLRTSGPEIVPPPEVTVGWVIEHLWKPTLKHRAPATRDKNEALIKHTAPLWRKPIRSVTIAEVEVLWDQLLDRGLSYHTVSGVKSQLKLAFDQAMKAEYVNRNVVAASKVERPRVSGEDGRVDPDEVLPPSEFARIVKAAPEWSKEAFVVLAFTGIRQGELAALRVKDWNGTHLSIRHSRSRATKRNSNTGEYGELGPAKTNASIRVLEVPPQVAEILNRRARGKRNEDWLFTGPRGGQLDPDHLRTRAWNKACAEVGVEGYTIHDLRDFAASIMIRKHVPPATISRFLGHAHVGVLYQRYAKFFREDDALAANALGDAFRSLDATDAFA